MGYKLVKFFLCPELHTFCFFLTHDSKLKKRLQAYAKKYPKLCKLIEDDEQGGLRFTIDKKRMSIRLTAPYSEERRVAAGVLGKENYKYMNQTKAE